MIVRFPKAVRQPLSILSFGLCFYLDGSYDTVYMKVGNKNVPAETTFSIVNLLTGDLRSVHDITVVPVDVTAQVGQLVAS